MKEKIEPHLKENPLSVFLEINKISDNLYQLHPFTLKRFISHAKPANDRKNYPHRLSPKLKMIFILCTVTFRLAFRWFDKSINWRNWLMSAYKSYNNKKLLHPEAWQHFCKIYLSIYLSIYQYIYIYIYTHNTYIDIYIYIYTYIYQYVYIHTYIHTYYDHIYLSIYLYIYIHTLY